MGKLTVAILEELTAYFRADALWTAIHAQGYEPGGAGFDPATDTRLVRLLERRRDPRARRAHMALDELDVHDVVVLRFATAAPSQGYPEVACRLPRALAHGRSMAEADARGRALEVELALARAQGLSPIACAARVLTTDAALEAGRRALTVTSRDVERATRTAVTHGLIDVAAEAEAVVDAAVDAYVVARDALREARRADRERLRAEASAAVDAALGRQTARAAARFERRLRGVA